MLELISVGVTIRCACFALDVRLLGCVAVGLAVLGNLRCVVALLSLLNQMRDATGGFGRFWKNNVSQEGMQEIKVIVQILLKTVKIAVIKLRLEVNIKICFS